MVCPTHDGGDIPAVRLFTKARSSRGEEISVKRRARSGGAIPVTNPSVYYFVGDMGADYVGPERNKGCWPLKTARQEGFPIAFGSDATAYWPVDSIRDCLGISTFSLMLPGKKTGVIVLTNLAGGRAGSIAEEPASDLLGRSLFGETGGGSLSFRTRYPVPAAGRLARYGGAYMFEQARLEVVPGEGGIDITHPVSEYTDEKVTSRLVAVADDTFMGRQEGGLAQVVCFVRGPDGQVNGLLTGGNRLGRV